MIQSFRNLMPYFSQRSTPEPDVSRPSAMSNPESGNATQSKTPNSNRFGTNNEQPISHAGPSVVRQDQERSNRRDDLNNLPDAELLRKITARTQYGLLTPQTSFGETVLESEANIGPADEGILHVQPAKAPIHKRNSRESSSATVRIPVPASTSTSEYQTIGVQTSPTSSFASGSTSSPVLHISPLSAIPCTRNPEPLQSSFARTQNQPPPPPPPSPIPNLPSTSRAAPFQPQKCVANFIKIGEMEANSVERDLEFLARERQRLTAELERISASEAELLTLFVDSDAADLRPSDSASYLPVNAASSAELATFRHSRIAVDTRSTKARTSASGQTEGDASRCPGGLEAPFSTVTSLTSGPPAISYTFAEGTSSNSVVSGVLSEVEEMERLSAGQRNPDRYFVWLDVETTDAIRPAPKVRILEIAVLVTDEHYRPFDEGVTFLVHWPLTAEELAAEMNDKVRKMHSDSGLLREYAAVPPSKRLTLEKVERKICRYLDKHFIRPNQRAIMAGAGVAFDRGMVRTHMEKLDMYFSHQTFDTTAIWHLMERFYNLERRFDVHVQCAHRAKADILGAIAEARMYAQLFLKGPETVNWPADRHPRPRPRI